VGLPFELDNDDGSGTLATGDVKGSVGISSKSGIEETAGGTGTRETIGLSSNGLTRSGSLLGGPGSLGSDDGILKLLHVIKYLGFLRIAPMYCFRNTTCLEDMFWDCMKLWLYMFRSRMGWCMLVLDMDRDHGDDNDGPVLYVLDHDIFVESRGLSFLFIKRRQHDVGCLEVEPSRVDMVVVLHGEYESPVVVQTKPVSRMRYLAR